MVRINPKPLSIGLVGIGFDNPALTRFKDKGHTFYVADYDVVCCDVIIGPTCWRIDPKLKLGDDSTEEESLERQLEMMEKSIRAIKYPKEKKE